MTNDTLMPLDGTESTRHEVDFDLASPLELSVTNSSGEIEITTSDRQNIVVVAERTQGGNDESRIEVEVSGNKVSVHPNWQISDTVSEIARKVKTQLKEGFDSTEWDFKKLRLGVNARFDIKIELPRALAEHSSVAVKTASGDTSASDIAARVSVATANGDISLNRLTGKISAHSASGDIEVHQIDGSIEANTANGDIDVENGEAWTALRAVNGDIKVSNFTMKNARVTTVSGDVAATVVMNNKATYSFDTVSGDVELNSTLAPTGASLNFRAVSGDANVSGDWTPATGKRTWQLAAGPDGPDIRVKAVSGDLEANATTDPTVTVVEESTPQDVAREQEKHDDGTSESGASADFDWEKAKSWVSSVTQKISQVVNEMDEAGDRHREQRAGTTSASVEPLAPKEPSKPTPPSPPSTPQTPPTPTQTPPAHTPGAQTEPVDVPPAHSETAPFTPADPEAAASDDTTETTSQKRLRLLEAVQRGEMTVDEALAQLDGNTHQ